MILREEKPGNCREDTGAVGDIGVREPSVEQVDQLLSGGVARGLKRLHAVATRFDSCQGILTSRE
jgi:hypothetical protein